MTHVKWPGESGAARKSVYHSFLVREGRTMVKFKGDPRDSKYPGKPPFVYIQVPDDQNEYALSLEPGTEDAVRNAPKNVWVYVKALGAGKDDPKELIVEEVAAALPGGADEWEPDEPPPSNEWPDDKPVSRPTPHAPPAQPKSNGHAPNALMSRCWGDAVALVRTDFLDATPDAAVEAASRIATTLFIRESR